MECYRNELFLGYLQIQLIIIRMRNIPDHIKRNLAPIKILFRRTMLLCFILLISSLNNFGKLGAEEIVKYGLKDGLSNNNVIGLAQDRNGLIWIATKSGLNQFDGHQFKVFKHIKNEPNSICSNSLNCIYADPNEDILWIGTEKNGLDAYNYKNQEFTHYTESELNGRGSTLSANGVTHIEGDGKGNLWLSTYMSGIDFFDTQKKEFSHFNTSNVKGLVSNYNWYVFPDGNRLFLGHVSQGLTIMNPAERTAVNFRHDPNNPNSIPDDIVTSIFKDSKNRIWICTRNGLAYFDEKNLSFINFRHNSDPGSLSHSFVERLMETPDGRLWVGTEGGGINILEPDNLDLSTGKAVFTRIPVSETPEGTPSVSVQSILVDKYSNLWFGGFIGGLNIIRHNKEMFRRIDYLPLKGYKNSLNFKMVNQLALDNNENLWATNGEGGICIYKNGEKIQDITRTPENNSLISISLIKDKQNRLWTGTLNGEIYIIDPITRKLSREKHFTGLNFVQIYQLFEDSRSNIWAATDIGLFYYNYRTGATGHLDSENSDIEDNNIRTICEDSRGNLWVGTLGGKLFVLDTYFNKIISYSNSFDFYIISSIYRDSQNRMWVCSANDLFLFKSPEIDSVSRFGIESGLIETNTRSIIEGEEPNEFWISTINNIVHFNLNKLQFRTYTLKDNISVGDYSGNSAVKLKNGDIYFGSQNGICYFNSKSDQTNSRLPGPVLSDILINRLNSESNDPFESYSASRLNDLKYNQNTIQIHFTTPDYSLCDKASYRYRLLGLDSEWFFLGNENQLTFRNLNPGRYELQIQSKLGDNEWIEEQLSLKFRIHPPFWFSWWAELIYTLLVISGIFFFVRFYRNKTLIENQLTIEKRTHEQEHKLNEEKLRFFTNITHELRTPMTLILGPLEDLTSNQNLSADVSRKINSIHSVSVRLLQLINQILEFRKSETSNRRLTIRKGDLSILVKEIGLKYMELNQNKSINFHLELPQINPEQTETDENLRKTELYFDHEVISIILDNLIGNAFKYTEKGHILLKLSQSREENIDYTVLTVEDSGYGISGKDLPHIFDRYYQAKNTTHPITGTGIGLSLVKNLVDLHQAEINVDSQINSGSKFTVRLLTNNTYPEAFHETLEEETILESTETDNRNVILVVDDNREILDYIQDSLSDSYQVLTAENGRKGLEIAREKIPDIVISDVMMPVMDGIEFCKTLKGDVSTSHIPIILLTAKSGMQDKAEGYDAGADSYLTKPFSANLLKSRINNIFTTRNYLIDSFAGNTRDKQALFNESASKLDKEFLEKLEMIIRSKANNEELNISGISDEMNMSHSTLYRKVKALTGITVNELIRKVRMHLAEELLLTNKYNISEVMYMVGVNSKSYFRQCFREEFGQNPSEYLQKLKDGSPEPEID